MNKRLYSVIWNVFFLCVVIFLLSGCAKQKLWYKAGNNQVDFDLDNRECVRVAKEVGRQATITGEMINPKVFNTSYNNCIFSRGWTHNPHNPPGTQQKKIKPVQLAKVKGNEIHVFDRFLTLPVDFKLINSQIAGFGDVRMQTLFFQGEGPVYLNMTFQETLSRQIDPLEFPANDPFFVFEKGKAGRKKMPLDWTVFSGDFKGTWVVGIGAYYLADKNKRINFVMTKDIPSQKKPPPQGLKLTKIQRQAVESFSDQWLERVKTAFEVGEKAEQGEKENLMMRNYKKIIQKIGNLI